ncbi:protein argonaute-2 [Uranotaenia lowii]|uniref:protein argonaute-2 n=1 Tax=Uranotaenia lowii TaxID=190385 RepID=UPI002478DA13|nr:protein argonaute-2 [Uranotaenia lowii]
MGKKKGNSNKPEGSGSQQNPQEGQQQHQGGQQQPPSAAQRQQPQQQQPNPQQGQQQQQQPGRNNPRQNKNQNKQQKPQGGQQPEAGQQQPHHQGQQQPHHQGQQQQHQGGQQQPPSAAQRQQPQQQQPNPQGQQQQQQQQPGRNNPRQNKNQNKQQKPQGGQQPEPGQQQPHYQGQQQPHHQGQQQYHQQQGKNQKPQHHQQFQHPQQGQRQQTSTDDQYQPRQQQQQQQQGQGKYQKKQQTQDGQQQQQGKGAWKQRDVQQKQHDQPAQRQPWNKNQQQAEMQRPQQPQSQPEQRQSSVPRSDNSSPSHAAGLERVEENLGAMKLDKQRVHTSNLLPVLQRDNTSGTLGTPIRMEVNYVRLMIEKLIGKAYHYDINIQPMASRIWQRAAFDAFATQVLPNFAFAFDGNKNAYSANRVPADHYKQDVRVSNGGRERTFTVELKEAAVVDLGSLKNYLQNKNLDKPMAAIQCLDVVLRTAYEKNNNFVKFKRSVYMIPKQPEDVGSNHELWYGLFQSAILGSVPYLNIDVSHKAFPSGGEILKILSDLTRINNLNEPLQQWAEQELNNYLKGMEIMYHGPDGVQKLYKFNGLRGPANQQKFKNQDGMEMTVAQYFQQRGKPLRYPNLPVMHVGSSVRNVMLPMELCTVPRGQALNKKHPDRCTQFIIRKSATDTATRKRKIMDIFNQIGYNTSKTVNEFGLKVGTNFETIEGRIINPPGLLYANNSMVKPMPLRGVWRADDKKFIVPSTDITKKELSWAILNLDSRTPPNNVQEFGYGIFNMSGKQGISMSPFNMRTHYRQPNVEQRQWTRDRTIDLTLEDIKKEKLDLVFVIVPESREDIYAKVKQKAELSLGILTQCIKSNTIYRKRTDASTIANIWLKINAKTNGSNHVIVPGNKPPLIRQKVMFIGADVTHPSPDQSNIPSVVGVAASYDLEGFRYNFCYRLQGPREEIICDLENIVERQLRQFQKQNNALPELLMYYRDGVSDGQFREVLSNELRAIQAAIAKFGQKYAPKITFIVVQKRHHTRFFPADRCPTEGKNQNLPPGTIVDKNITTPNQYQFFLISHAAVQGVAKPTKYAVLYDDANCKPDELQATTYYLCHLFARCNRSVSYPAPTYYAHLAAYRGRVYIKDRRLNMENLAQEYSRMQLKSEIIDGHPMFFV